jgi:hypothetical protein
MRLLTADVRQAWLRCAGSLIEARFSYQEPPDLTPRRVFDAAD